MSTDPQIQRGQPIVMSTAELAMRWNVSIRTIQRLNKKGQLPAAFRVGRALRYSSESIAKFESATLKDGCFP